MKRNVVFPLPKAQGYASQRLVAQEGDTHVTMPLIGSLNSGSTWISQSHVPRDLISVHLQLSSMALAAYN
jgi:hypothetical protein